MKKQSKPCFQVNTVLLFLMKSRRHINSKMLKKHGNARAGGLPFPVGTGCGIRRSCGSMRHKCNEPEIILADEPTGNLDSATPQKISQCEFLTSTERDAILPFESGYDK